MAMPANYGTEQAPTGELNKLFRQLQKWYRYDITHVKKWRKEAKESEDFYANKQWSKEDQQALKDQNRPEVTFNRIGPLVNAIVGSEINNRREVRFFPREEGDAKANEVLTAAAEWFRDECGAEDEESDAFKSVVITGMGWTDTRLDFESNPDGDPKVDNIDALEMVWDCNSQKPNLSDAGRMFRVREMPYSEAEELTGETDRAKLHAAWAAPDKLDDETHDQDKADEYSGEQSDISGEAYEEKKCILVEARWLEKESYYRGPDLQNPGQIKEYTKEQADALKAVLAQQGMNVPVVKQTRKAVRRAFLGSEVLGKPDKPMAPTGMFGWECITGYRDKTENQWYGIIRAAKDPARWSNKFFSQVMYLLNSQAKGGVIAERGAFENDRDAEKSWAKADAITWAADGSLSGDKPKIMPKSPAAFPAGFFTLFQESKEAISDVTGLSLEFIGTREVDQAGVLEYQRRQSSLNLLAELFNALRRYRKRQGKTMLFLIQEHLADNRLIRITGDDLAQYVRLSKSAVADKSYDIIVDDSPTSPNEKDRTWQILQQMLPFVKDMLTPDIVLEILAISPLPASLVQKLRDKAKLAAQQPQPPTPEEMKVQAEQQKHEMDMAGKQADLSMKQQENQMDVEMKGIDLMVEQREAELEAVRNERKFEVDMRQLAVKERQNAIAAKNAGSRRTSAANG